MNHKAYQPKMPDRMEAVFDAAYLIFDLIAGILFFTMAQGRSLFILYGVLTLTLCGGDAFHLVPRIIRAVRGSSDRIKKQLGIGLQVSSITMTVFYIILLYVWKATFPQLQAPVAVEVLIWLSAILRILICLLPQNNWCTDEGNPTLSVLRNAVFGLYRPRRHHPVRHLRQYWRLPYDPDGGSHPYFLWLLPACDPFQ